MSAAPAPTEDGLKMLCRDPRWREPGQPIPWDHPRGSGRTPSDQVQLQRNEFARQLCLVCPALDWCEDRLVSYEKLGVYIDGIVAGRTSDVQPANGFAVNRHMSTCAGCGESMRPLAPSGRRAAAQAKHWKVQHVGEGLCQHCYPIMARKKAVHEHAS